MTLATAVGTHRFSSRFPRTRFIKCPHLGLTLSSLGFGSHRLGSHGEDEGVRAVQVAARGGINVFDTSGHFGNGRSERIIGTALRTLLSHNEISRDEVAIVTKLGFILGSENVTAWRAAPSASKDIALMPGGKAAHCISPRFVEGEITASLERLGVEGVDCVMLNMPERMLMATNRTISKAELHDIILSAFRHLEKEVDRGRIGSYGVCSNSLHLPDHPDNIGLSALLQASSDAFKGLQTERSSSAFKAIEYPLNLFERESIQSALLPTSHTSVCLATAASTAGLHQFTHRPLNAIAGERGAIRCLGDPGVDPVLVEAMEEVGGLEIVEEGEANGAEGEDTGMRRVDALFRHVGALEVELPDILGSEKEDMDAVSRLIWAETLSENFAALSSDAFAARHFVRSVVIPSLRQEVATLLERARAADGEGSTAVIEWARAYEHAVVHLCAGMVAVFDQHASERNEDLAMVVGALMPVRSLGSGDSEPVGLAELAVRFASAGLREACRAAGDEEGGTVLVGAERVEWAEGLVKIAGVEGSEGPSVEEIRTLIESGVLDGV
ncbi:hypothetical protein HK101_007912 [Irineochytrium annulatum]|nr:hypothetical protein HK101_007912 [Irineochytrium annulatum]